MQRLRGKDILVLEDEPLISLMLEGGSLSPGGGIFQQSRLLSGLSADKRVTRFTRHEPVPVEVFSAPQAVPGAMWTRDFDLIVAGHLALRSVSYRTARCTESFGLGH